KQSCNWTICIDQPCDYLVMNSVNNLKKALMYLQRYLHIHCYLDNDLAGQKTVETIAGLYGERVSNEAVRYSEYKDLNDCLRGKKR
ncbi:toprim domain-containing protein, partial [Bacteroides thetaiotaomicron]